MAQKGESSSRREHFHVKRLALPHSVLVCWALIWERKFPFLFFFLFQNWWRSQVLCVQPKVSPRMAIFRDFSVKCLKIALRHKASVAHKELDSLIYLLPAPAGWAPLGVKRPSSFSQVLQNCNIQLVKQKNNATERLWHFWTKFNFANEFCHTVFTSRSIQTWT